ncbi:galactoside 2-alpha-L-fucosyltransferase SEC1-like [Hetaerina americana]|uniref:galactoside 2-alpha-L-fucosyltransferase SEC1-like n=1 Tax=Hetaerina americana TaxID=62018 RepID=UPI003A7F256F
MNRKLKNYCPTKNIITVRSSGLLGDCVWEYASTVALGRLLALSPYISRSTWKCLRDTFQNLGVETYDETILSYRCQVIHGGDITQCKSPSEALYAKNTSSWNTLCNTLERGEPLGLGMSSHSTEELKEMLDAGQLDDVLILSQHTAHTEAIIRVGVPAFRKLFDFRSDVLHLATLTINGVMAAARIEDDVLFFGVHARRKDINTELERLYGSNFSLANADYYKRAMEKIRSLRSHHKVVFLVVSDDRQWCMNELVNETNGVFWGGMEESPFHSEWEKREANRGEYHDLALLASMDGNIISYGLYGLTGAILAGGHTIVHNPLPDDFKMETTGVTMAKSLEKWEFMN